MLIPPLFTITSEMLEIISGIDAKRIYFNSNQIPIALKNKIARVSILKSSLFSARIEGNHLDLKDLNLRQTDDIKKREVLNIQKAAVFLNSQKEKTITRDMILELHKIVLHNISIDAGKIRHEVSAIFNQAGVAVYMPPPPSEIAKLIDSLITYINSDKEKFPILIAFITHLVFEKIHPFIDGNGRVGRLLVGLVLNNKGWDFAFTVPFEEYLDENKEEYYYYLDNGLKSAEEYLLFMLKAFLNQLERTQSQIENEMAKNESIFLPPRQEEIFNIIKDLSIVSFDIVRRRFLKIPERTLRYDLKKLADKELIEKTGTTKGVYYRVRKK